MLNESNAMDARAQHPLVEAYLALMRDSRLWSGSLDDALRMVLATVNAALRTQRTWLWSFTPDHERLTLVLGYEAADQSFTHGAELHCAQFPEYFRRFESLYVEAIADIRRDSSFREFIAQGLVSPDIKALLNSAVHVASKSWGMLVASDYVAARIWSAPEHWFIASIADLIAQLITYAEVRRNEHWLRFVADTLPIGILKYDLEASCVYANPYWLNLTGTDAAANRGDGWMRSLHPGDRDTVLDIMRTAAMSGERGDAELRILARNQTHWVAGSWVCERNVEGLPVAILGTFADVTYERKLRENERRYRTLFDNSNDAVLIGRGRYAVDCNARALEMFACAREQIIGETPGRFSPPSQPDGRSSSEFVEKIAAAERGQRQVFEWQYMRLDGTLFPAEVALSYITINEEPHLLAAIRDIGQRRAAEDALRQSNERLHRINSIAARLYGLRDVEAVARASVQILSEHGSAPLARFFVYDAATHIATLVAQRDGLGLVLGPAGSLTQWTLYADIETEYEADIAILNDLDLLPTTTVMREAMRERGTRSIVCIWLRGEVDRIGLIVLEYREVIALEPAQRDDLVAIGNAVSMALSNVLFIARIEQQATHDTLTGLPNRELLRRELQTLDTEPARASGLMLLDLDRFKEVNDTLGHHVGDQLLVSLAQRLSNGLQEKNALLCRLGGDEFAILMRDATPLRLKEAAEGLLELLRQQFIVDDIILEIGGSIGIALFPQQSASGVGLLRLADVAMYQAKRNGSGWALYDREFDSYTPERLALMQELRSAIANRELVLHYQPRLNLRTGSVDGFEALVRWQHQQHGLLAPGVFLPFAEVSDVIHALTIDVLERALLQQRDWLRRGLRYSIAVNLSARNLINEQCFIQLRQMMEKYHSDASLLEFEITETALMQDPVGAAKLLASLAELGIKFSIDDFGTGYSSLAYLHQLPIHALKIDRTFVGEMVRNEHDAMIVKSTIALAHNLNLDVIAEGVEDEATLALLRSMNCDQVQGYFVSRPQPAEVIEQWLGKAAWPRA